MTEVGFNFTESNYCKRCSGYGCVQKFSWEPQSAEENKRWGSGYKTCPQCKGSRGMTLTEQIQQTQKKLADVLLMQALGIKK